MRARTRYFVAAIVAGVLLVAAFLLFAQEEKRAPQDTTTEEERRSRAILCSTGRRGVERCGLYLCKVAGEDSGRLVCEVVRRYPPEPRT